MNVLDWFVIVAGAVVVLMGIATLWPFIDAWRTARRDARLLPVLAELTAKQERGEPITDGDVERLMAVSTFKGIVRGPQEQRMLVMALISRRRYGPRYRA